MRTLAAIKIVPDSQDIRVDGSGALDYSKARWVVSEYDLNAIEAAAQLASATDGSAAAITVGPKKIDDSKTKKNILARGIDELFMTADDACADMDAFATGKALAELVGQTGAYDLIVVGDGSADMYAKQVGAQLAAALAVPYVAGICAFEAGEGVLIAKRRTENEIENLEIPLPAVISVLPEAAKARICGMKDILAAGKKPMNAIALGVAPESATEVLSCKAPEQAERKLEIMNAGDEGAVEKFAAALKAAL